MQVKRLTPAVATALGNVFAKVRDPNLASVNVAIRLGMTVRSHFITRYRDIDMPHLAFAVSRRKPTAPSRG